MHTAACDAAAAAVMARSKGTFEKLKDWFFMHQDELSPVDDPATPPTDVGGITDFDAQYDKALQEVKTDASIGTVARRELDADFFVNGKRIPGGGLPPQYFDDAIELELKRAK